MRYAATTSADLPFPVTVTKVLAAYAVTTLVLFAIDMVWLRVIAFNWYQQGIGHLMTTDVKLWAALLFYLLYPVGLVLFAVVPGLDSATVWRSALLGAAFGFFAYATYDLTNLATLKGWPMGLAVMDVAWGTFASAVAATAGRLVAPHVA